MPKPDEKPTPTKLSQLRDWLKSQGLSAAQANLVIKAGRTRAELAVDIRTWLKSRPEKS
jgi:hypothetical protein